MRSSLKNFLLNCMKDEISCDTLCGYLGLRKDIGARVDYEHTVNLSEGEKQLLLNSNHMSVRVAQCLCS